MRNPSLRPDRLAQIVVCMCALGMVAAPIILSLSPAEVTSIAGPAGNLLLIPLYAFVLLVLVALVIWSAVARLWTSGIVFLALATLVAEPAYVFWNSSSSNQAAMVHVEHEWNWLRSKFADVPCRASQLDCQTVLFSSMCCGGFLDGTECEDALFYAKFRDDADRSKALTYVRNSVIDGQMKDVSTLGGDFYSVFTCGAF